MVNADKSLKAFSKTYKAYRKRTVLQYLAYRIVRIEFFRIDPYTLSHKERIVLYSLLRLYFKSVEELVNNKVHSVLKHIKELDDIAARKDTESGQVDRRK